MKKNRIDADLKENRKQSMREIEDRAIEIGMKVHNEVRVKPHSTRTFTD